MPEKADPAAKSSIRFEAKDADVYLLTHQRFSEFRSAGTSPSSKDLKRVSDANPQKAEFAVGHFRAGQIQRTPTAFRFRRC